jgi:hypothetical protein
MRHVEEHYWQGTFRWTQRLGARHTSCIQGWGETNGGLPEAMRAGQMEGGVVLRFSGKIWRKGVEVKREEETPSLKNSART